MHYIQTAGLRTERLAKSLGWFSVGLGVAELAAPSRVARLRLAQAVENQFDTSVVAAFEAILASADERYRSATSEEFRPGQPSREDVPSSPDRDVAVGIA